MVTKLCRLDEILVIDISRREHRCIVKKIKDAGFNVPEKRGFFRPQLGHVTVPIPMPTHPTAFGDTKQTRTSEHDCLLPVAYIHPTYIELVNTQYPQLTLYHDHLRDLF